MAKIRKEDLFDSNLFKGTTDEINLMIKAVDKLKNQMIELMTVSKQALKNKPINTEGLKKQAELTKQVSQADKNLITLEKERIRLVNKLNQQAEKQAQNNARTKIQIQERTKSLKQQAKAELGLISAYDKESQRLTRLRKKYKDLIISGKGTAKQTRQLAKEIQKLDSRLKNVDAKTGQYTRNVGNYGSALNKMKMGFSNILSGAGLTLGIAGAIRTIQNGIKTFSEFEQSNANLASVLGKVTDSAGTWQEKTKQLADDARRLGGSTVFTAGQVSELQTEFARLGFEQEQIIKITQSTLDASAAMQSDLGEQAALTGAVLKAFALDGEEATRVNDVMAKATASSALSFQKLSTALPTVSPVANALGISLERTTAMLGKLTDNGIDASTSATGLRNVFLTLSKEGISFEDAMNKIASSSDQAKTSFELFGKRGATIGVVLANSTIEINDLDESLQNAGGTAKNMAETQLDTLEGAIKLLQSAWSELMISLAEGGRQFISLKSIIQFVANNLGTIVKVVKFATIAFVSYKTSIIAVNLATKLYRTLTIGARIATIAFSGGLKGARRAMQLLNTSIKANPIGLLVSVITTAIALFMDFSDEVDESKEAIDRLAQAYKELNDQQKKYFEDADKEQEIRLAQIDLEIQKAKELGANAQTIHDLNMKRIDEEKRANMIKDSRAFDALQEMIKLRDEAKNVLDKDNESLAFAIKLQDSNSRQLRNKGEEDEKFYKNRLKNSQLTFDNAQAQVDAQEKLLKQLEHEAELLRLKGLTAESELKIQLKKNKSKKKGLKTQKQENIFAKEKLKIERELLKISTDYNKVLLQRGIDSREIDANNQLDFARQQANDLDFVDPDQDGDVNDIVIPNLDEYQRSLNMIRDLKIMQLDADSKLEKQELKNSLDDYKTFLNNQVKAGKLTKDEQDKLIELAEKNHKQELLILEQNYQKDKKEIENEAVQNFKNAQDEINQIAETTNEKRLKGFEDLKNKQLEETRQLVQASNALLDMLQARNDERTRKQLENIDKEIEASKKRFDELKQLSILGNEDAEKSALFEIRRQEELERKKQKLQRRQQLVNAGITAFKVYGQKIEQGEENPLASTLADMTAITAFIQSLPTFIEGTENVGKSLGKPDLKGQDGYIVRVDANERIIDPKNNQKMSGIDNDTLGDIAYNYKNNTIETIGYNKLNNSAYEMLATNITVNHQLENQLKLIAKSNNKIISAIEHIPHESWDYDKMSDAVIQKIKNQKKTEIRHFKNNSLY
tara:strand:+ start:16182 stop:19943 length:3762 start_codon:yes stop_codon:yes gene_type:complete